MGRGLARRPRPCAEHPHRPAADHCDECWGLFCADCLVREGARRLCRACWRAAPVRAAEQARRRRLGYRFRAAVRARQGDLLIAGLVLGALGLMGLASAGWIVDAGRRAAMEEPVVRMVEARRVLRMGGPIPTPVDPAAPPQPTRIPTLFQNPLPMAGPVGSNLSALLDGRAGERAPGWRSAGGYVPVELRFQTGEPVLAARVLFGHSEAAPPETWAREVEVWLAPTPDDAELALVGRWTLAQTTQPQEFSFPCSRVRAARLRINSNYGSADYTSLAEFALLPAR